MRSVGPDDDVGADGEAVVAPTGRWYPPDGTHSTLYDGNTGRDSSVA